MFVNGRKVEKRIDLSKKLGLPQRSCFDSKPTSTKTSQKTFNGTLACGYRVCVCVFVSLKSKDSHVSVQFFRFLGFIPEWPAGPSYNRHWCRPARDIGRWWVNLNNNNDLRLWMVESRSNGGRDRGWCQMECNTKPKNDFHQKHANNLFGVLIDRLKWTFNQNHTKDE